NGEDACFALGHGCFGIRGGLDFEFATVGNEPHPAAAELIYAMFDKFFFELIETAKVTVDILFQFSGRWSAMWRQTCPEKSVIPRLRGIVEDRAAARLLPACSHYVIQRHGRKAGVSDKFVELFHIRFVVLAVMEIHGLAGDHRR